MNDPDVFRSLAHSAPRRAQSRKAGLFCALLMAGLAAACARSGGPNSPTTANKPPKADFIYNPVSPIYAGVTAVTFNASPSVDTDGTIATYTWNFGDGSPIDTVRTATIVHVFTDTAARCSQVTYAVLLTVVDDRGDRDSRSTNVNVIELPEARSLECQ